jgi:hypothetical protein
MKVWWNMTPRSRYSVYLLYTGTKVQILTPEWNMTPRSRYSVYLLYTGTKVQILTPEELQPFSKPQTLGAMQKVHTSLALLVQKYKY